MQLSQMITRFDREICWTNCRALTDREGGVTIQAEIAPRLLPRCTSVAALYIRCLSIPPLPDSSSVSFASMSMGFQRLSGSWPARGRRTGPPFNERDSRGFYPAISPIAVQQAVSHR